MVSQKKILKKYFKKKMLSYISEGTIVKTSKNTTNFFQFSFKSLVKGELLP